MADDYELQNITTWRLRELLQHEKDNHALRAANAKLLAAAKEAYVALPRTKHNEAINAALVAAIEKAEAR